MFSRGQNLHVTAMTKQSWCSNLDVGKSGARGRGSCCVGGSWLGRTRAERSRSHVHRKSRNVEETAMPPSAGADGERQDTPPAPGGAAALGQSGSLSRS